MQDIEHVPFDGLTDFFKTAARGLAIDLIIVMLITVWLLFVNRIFGDTKPTISSNDYSTIVIFIVGGITAHEIQLIHEYGQQIKKQVRQKEAFRRKFNELLFVLFI